MLRILLGCTKEGEPSAKRECSDKNAISTLNRCCPEIGRFLPFVGAVVRLSDGRFLAQKWGALVDSTQLVHLDKKETALNQLVRSRLQCG